MDKQSTETKKPMKIYHFLFSEYKSSIILALLTSIVSAVAGIAVLSGINDMITAQGFIPEIFTRTLLFLFLLVATGLTSQIMFVRLASQVTCRLRRVMVKRVLDTELEIVEKLGGGKIYATLTQDIQAIGIAFDVFPFLLYNLVLLVVGFSYLGTLSLQMLSVVIVFLITGAAVAHFFLKKMRFYYDAQRESEDRVYQGFQSVIEGGVNMLLNTSRQQAFYENEFKFATQQARNNERKAGVFWIYSRQWSLLVALGLITLIFWFGRLFELPVEIVVAFAMALLFLRTSINDLMAGLPNVLKGNVAIRKVASLRLAEYQSDFQLQTSTKNLPSRQPVLNLINVEYQYQNENEDYQFHLGPINLEIKAGELLFIIGGNGSGKSTLAKVLTGLYAPTAGEVRWRGGLVDDNNRVDYRGRFSCVFSTFYLFDRLVGPDQKFDRQLADSFLEVLKMTHKVSIEEQCLSTTSLSQGQRKRLALLHAYVEDRPVWLLDEWAADQDPEYRTFFYQQLLPQLQRKGITIIAISHDEQYFYLADRVLKCTTNGLMKVDIDDSPPLEKRTQQLTAI